MRNVIGVVAAVAVISAGCAGPSDNSDDSVVAVSAPAVTGAVSDAGSVVRVVTKGTFVTPDFGQLDSVAGSGSAFIIDESGLAVTNNHVVAGAASVEVFMDGVDDPIAAEVVGRSECSDLAVIDLAGDGYRPLAWATDPASVGLQVSAVGYPQGNPELIVTDGIVSRVDDDGATPWAAIPSLLRHDAGLQPGNSGGPLLNANGAVVGVNVAASDSGRYAIPATTAEAIVDELRTGVDVESLGVNAVAVLDELTNDSGVWVVSVEPGSEAAALGLRAGDTITRMNGVRIGRDATMADYCAILRTTGDKELLIEVTRGDELLAGSTRGGELEPVLVAIDEMVAVAADPPPVVEMAPPPGIPYTAFETVTDVTGTISLDVPTVWADRDVEMVSVIDVNRATIRAGFDLAALDIAAGTTYDQAGVAAIVYNTEADIAEAFDVITKNSPWMYDCTPLERGTFNDAVYSGVSQAFADCAGTPSTVFSVALRRGSDTHWMLMNIFAPTVADLDAALRIAATYEFNPEALASVAVPVAPAAEAAVPVEPAVVVASVEELIALVGQPPMSAGATTQDRYQRSLTVGYPSTATHEEIQAWIDTRTNEVGCTDPFTSQSNADGNRYYAVSCDYQDGRSFSYSLRVFTFGDSASTFEVTASEWEDE